MLILQNLSTHSVLFDIIVYSCGKVMTHNCTVWCHPEEDCFPFQPGYCFSILSHLLGIILKTVLTLRVGRAEAFGPTWLVNIVILRVLLTHLHHLNLLQRSCPLHHILWASRNQAADIRKPPFEDKIN